MKSHHTRILLFATCLTGMLAAALGVTTVQDNRQAGARQQQQIPQHPIEVFRLQNASAEDVLGALHDIVSYRPDLGESLAVESSTNTLLLALTPERMEVVRPLIAQLDVPEGSVESQEIFRLRHAAAADTAILLERIFHGTTLAVDARNNSIIVQGAPHKLNVMRGLVAEVDQADGADPSRLNQQLQLRVIWLVDGAEGLDRTPPDDLQPVLEELSRYGVDDLDLVGQSILRTTPGTNFNHGFASQIDHRWNVEVAGMIEPVEAGGWRTHFMLEALQVFDPDLDTPQGSRGRNMAASGAMRQIQHETTIVTRSGRFVVLAMSPTDQMTSVFVLQITEVDD